MFWPYNTHLHVSTHKLSMQQRWTISIPGGVTRYPVTFPLPCFYGFPPSRIGSVWPWRTFNCYFNTKQAVWAQVMVHLCSCGISPAAARQIQSLEIRFLWDHVGSVCWWASAFEFLREFMLHKNNLCLEVQQCHLDLEWNGIHTVNI